MKSEDFQGLLESVREAKQILRGEKKATREFIVEVPPVQSIEQTSYVICVQTDDPSLLIPRKIYEAIYSQSGLVRVVDEAGAAALYPEDFFLPIAFPKEVEQVLAQVDD
ncbi:MAG: hypothetical protein MOB07_12105 [Acidobacteria bacterium]|nr:hypothetical protein [Acidobacteriota bacterium]